MTRTLAVRIPKDVRRRDVVHNAPQAFPPVPARSPITTVAPIDPEQMIAVLTSQPGCPDRIGVTE